MRVRYIFLILGPAGPKNGQKMTEGCWHPWYSRGGEIVKIADNYQTGQSRTRAICRCGRISSNVWHSPEDVLFAFCQARLWRTSPMVLFLDALYLSTTHTTEALLITGSIVLKLNVNYGSFWWPVQFIFQVKVSGSINQPIIEWAPLTGGERQEGWTCPRKASTCPLCLCWCLCSATQLFYNPYYESMLD